MADDDNRRDTERTGEEPSGRKRPLRASGRARLRGEDGVRRDDYYGPRASQITPAGPTLPEGATPGSTDPPTPQAGTAPTPADPSATAFPTRRARREAQAREHQHGQDMVDGQRPASSHSDAYDPFNMDSVHREAAEPSATPRHARRRADGAADTFPGRQGASSTRSTSGASRTRTLTSTGSATAGATAAIGASSDPAGTDDRALERDYSSSPRHSRREGDAFPSIVRWTALGTLLPGLGLIRGRSKIGWVLLIGFLATVAAVLLWVIVRSPVTAVARVAGSPTILYTLAVILGIGILIWVFTIFRSYAVLRRGHRMTDFQKWLGWGMVASLIVCVGVPLGVGSAYSKVHADAIVQVFGRDGGDVRVLKDLWGDTERINVFMIGRDDGDSREGTRPDTMLIASIEPNTGNATLISVPRNLNRAMFPEGSPLAERFPYGFDGFGPDESMINAVWTWAAEYPHDVGPVPDGIDVGMEATMQAVEGSLGLSLDYFASVDMQGFEDVIDSIGGVKIDVERPIPIGGGTNLNTGLKNPIYGWIDPGEQKLSGADALWYVRSRDGADNYDRMCRQQRMIKLTLDQVNPQELAVAYPKLAGSAGRNIQTDIPQSEVSAFVELAVAMQRGEIKSAQITNDVTSTTNPDYELLHEWVQEQIDPAVPSQAEQTEEETATPEAEETPEAEPTGAPAVGIEDGEGKCYPKGYTPGTGWPGWPGNAENAGTTGEEG